MSLSTTYHPRRRQKNMTLTAERLREVMSYDPETGVLTWLEQRNHLALAGSIAGYCERDGYRRIKFLGKKFKAHRLAWLFVYGTWPAHEIDHVDGNKDNNRIENLRPASRAQNLRNCGKRKTNTSGYKGVSWHKGKRKWSASIGVNGRLRHLGYYQNIECAAAAYASAAEKFHGDYANVGATPSAPRQR